MVGLRFSLYLPQWNACAKPACAQNILCLLYSIFARGYLAKLIPSEALCRLGTCLPYTSLMTIPRSLHDCSSSQWPKNLPPLIAKQQHHSSSTSATAPPASIVSETSLSHRHQIPIHTSLHIYRSTPGPPAHSASSLTSSPQPCLESFPIQVLARA